MNIKRIKKGLEKLKTEIESLTEREEEELSKEEIEDKVKEVLKDQLDNAEGILAKTDGEIKNIAGKLSKGERYENLILALVEKIRTATVEEVGKEVMELSRRLLEYTEQPILEDKIWELATQIKYSEGESLNEAQIREKSLEWANLIVKYSKKEWTEEEIGIEIVRIAVEIREVSGKEINSSIIGEAADLVTKYLSVA